MLWLWADPYIRYRFYAAYRITEPIDSGLSMVELQSYVADTEEMNQILSSESLEEALTTITFTEALSSDMLQEYVETYNIEIVQIQARGFDADGNRITFFSRTDEGIEETFSILAELASSDGVELSGVIGMYALTNSQTISLIQADQYTFLADTSGDAFFTGNQDTYGIQRNSEAYGNTVSKAFPQSVAWNAEDLGLVDYSCDWEILSLAYRRIIILARRINVLKGIIKLLMCASLIVSASLIVNYIINLSPNADGFYIGTNLQG